MWRDYGSTITKWMYNIQYWVYNIQYNQCIAPYWEQQQQRVFYSNGYCIIYRVLIALFCCCSSITFIVIVIIVLFHDSSTITSLFHFYSTIDKHRTIKYSPIIHCLRWKLVIMSLISRNCLLVCKVINNLKCV